MRIDSSIRMPEVTLKMSKWQRIRIAWRSMQPKQKRIIAIVLGAVFLEGAATGWMIRDIMLRWFQ